MIAIFFDTKNINIKKYFKFFNEETKKYVYNNVKIKKMFIIYIS